MSPGASSKTLVVQDDGAAFLMQHCLFYLSCAVLFILLNYIFPSKYDLSSDLVILLLGILFLRKHRECTRRFSFL